MTYETTIDAPSPPALPPAFVTRLAEIVAQVGAGRGTAMVLGATTFAGPLAAALERAGWRVVVADNCPEKHGCQVGSSPIVSFDAAIATAPAVFVCAADQGRAGLLWQLLRHPGYLGQPVHQVTRPDSDARSTPALEGMTLDQDDVELALQWLDQGDRWDDDDEVRAFAGEFARWNGSVHAWAFMSGREALSACLAAFALSPGTQVLVPGYTCIAVDNAVRFAGLQPVYCDIELETYGLDFDCVRARIGHRTGALVLPHHYGLVSRDYLKLIEWARSRKLRVVEDCAHSTGAMLDGRRVGVLGDAAIYSSEQSKVFNTTTGGLAVTNDAIVAEGLERHYRAAARADESTQRAALSTVLLNYYSLKHRCRDWTKDVVQTRYGDWHLKTVTRQEIQGERPAGYGRRMTAPLAALGRNQLRKLDAYNERRRLVAAHWDRWASSTNHPRPTIVPGSKPAFLRYPTRVPPARKADLDWTAAELGVEAGTWFRTHLHPSVRSVPDCPNAAEAVATCINLPCLLEA